MRLSLALILGLAAATTAATGPASAGGVIIDLPYLTFPEETVRPADISTRGTTEAPTAPTPATPRR
ncbi:hypothetical protein ATO8_10673 [Roseivivax marinus]|jgi:hypothetical protein|uniref:Uncharacterized protein n=1 Tax=Roseivivax marinus TaxID=1379903 RepID=W4HJU6_9RHOB|nr:hypothetical protein [Roseivivax marinus]ETW13002.1 hypothetical protein ATO8_10673 [Roseivivax marinus]UMA64447.1 hypothetical protein LVO79_15750 [Roseivivax marinus]SEL83042.1 hypothetical protein SAMN05444413_11767 [Roseivivax marinus]